MKNILSSILSRRGCFRTRRGVARESHHHLAAFAANVAALRALGWRQAERMIYVSLFADK